MPLLHLITGPPFAAPFWDAVATRLTTHAGLRPSPVDVLGLPAPATVEAIASSLGATWSAQDVAVAHGTAVPVALAAAAARPPAALILVNGPIGSPGPALGALGTLGRVPGLVPGALLRPAVWTGWLASSAGLRRSVVNPYVMDRDTVVALCAPGVSSAEVRQRTASLLVDIAVRGDTLPVPACPLGAVWGSGDRLYPPRLLDRLRARRPDLVHVDVPGGAHAHPVERPWFIADAIPPLLARLLGQAPG